MKAYSQTFLFIAVLGISILVTKSTPPENQNVLINASASNTTVEATAPNIAQETKSILGQNPEEPSFILKTNSALAKKTNGEAIFYELNADARWPLASLTKLMTAVIAFESLPETQERNALIKRMMIISENAAAETLANTLNYDEYIRRMNEKATDLNMRSTGFRDATGLSYLNQSTVRDLDVLIQYIYNRHPQLFAWSREKTIQRNGKTLTNINHFVTRSDFLGGKTGFTDIANGNLISLFKTDEGPVTIIILGAKDQNERFTETERLLTWLSLHFKHYEY